jgi:thiopurine S-methyltransferase
MNKSFWIEKWDNNQIRFHKNEANPALISYFKELSLEKQGRLFLPLCGKTLDIAWILSQGQQVVGAEFSEIAIQQLFTELEIEPQVKEVGRLKLYSAENIDMYVGDIFDLSNDVIGIVDAIYDRAALVALPDEMRIRYSKHLIDITSKAPQLLITFEYDQSEMQGPPFSINSEEVKRHYVDSYELKLIKSLDIPGGLKGVCSATEHIWLLK